MLQVQACFPFQLQKKFKPPITILKVAPTTSVKQKGNWNLEREVCIFTKVWDFSKKSQISKLLCVGRIKLGKLSCRSNWTKNNKRLSSELDCRRSLKHSFHNTHSLILQNHRHTITYCMPMYRTHDQMITGMLESWEEFICVLAYHICLHMYLFDLCLFWRHIYSYSYCECTLSWVDYQPMLYENYYWGRFSLNMYTLLILK
mgnify:CR=1 FL=1